MKKLTTIILFLLLSSCVSKSAYMWLDKSKIDEAILQMNLIVDEMNSELVQMCKKKNLEIVDKVPYVTGIEVSLDGKKIKVDYSEGPIKVFSHNEFRQCYYIDLDGSYRDKFGTDCPFSRGYCLENK